MRSLPLLISIAGCWTSSQPGDPPQGNAAALEVAIASVRLGDDCPGGIADGKLSQDRVSDSAGITQRRSFRAEICEQSLLQVSLRSTTGAKTPIAVTKIELFDAAGVSIGALDVRTATRWTNDGSYAKWDQVVGPGEVVAASYALTAPDWGLVPGGRDPSKKIRVRVTFTIGAGERVFEKEATVAAFSDPNVMTWIPRRPSHIIDPSARSATHAP